MSEKLRILVADDDHGMARTMRDIFKVKGYLAEAVYLGTEALEKIREGEFDCVLADIKMPGMNVVELYREIKAFTCLYKPLQIEELLRVLSRIRHLELGRVLGGTAGEGR